MQNWHMFVDIEKQQGKLIIQAVAGVEVDKFMELMKKIGRALQNSGEPEMCNVGNKILIKVENE